MVQKEEPPGRLFLQVVLCLQTGRSGVSSVLRSCKLRTPCKESPPALRALGGLRPHQAQQIHAAPGVLLKGTAALQFPHHVPECSFSVRAQDTLNLCQTQIRRHNPTSSTCQVLQFAKQCRRNRVLDTPQQLSEVGILPTFQKRTPSPKAACAPASAEGMEPGAPPNPPPLSQL